MVIFIMNRGGNKKGQSLVEVTVSLLILMIVFSSVLTLIVQSLNLVVMTRTRTEVGAIAQHAMTDVILQIKNTCPVKSAAEISNISPSITVDPKYTLTVTAKLLTSNDQPTRIGPLPSSFYKVTVIVSWTDKGATGQSSYALTQLVSQ
jgi:type II secretory pathway pseudopilin PulG